MPTQNKAVLSKGRLEIDLGEEDTKGIFTSAKANMAKI